MNRPFSGKQIDKLGLRLAQPGEVSEDDRAMLELLLESYDQALTEVRRIVVGAIGRSPTGRIKTLQTTREKLARGTALSRMQDIAGLRVVLSADESRASQDRAVEAIERAFEKTKRIDRRLRPTHGYRAVHVIVFLGGCPVEVQVRTNLQDLWAQVLERLGDTFGREIRYGELFANEEARQVVEFMGEVSADIASLEEVQELVENIEGRLAGIDFDHLDDEDLRVVDAFYEIRDLVHDRAALLRDRLDALSALVNPSRSDEDEALPPGTVRE